MSEDQEDRLEFEPTADRHHHRRRRGFVHWLPAIMIIGITGTIIGWAWSIDMTLDYKIGFSQIGTLVGWFLLTLWFAFFSDFSRRTRYLIAFIPWAMGITAMALVKADYTGDVWPSRFVWRWAATEDSRLAVATAVTATTRADLTQTTPQDYPRFLGPNAIPMIQGLELATDWKARPPELIWRQPIGAGWSGFAIAGDYAVTQEQRGDQELVVCYELKTGRTVWTHANPGRFTSVLGGDGPRATPTIADGKVYTHGASGILNCLDGATGEVLWSHDTLKENGADNIGWGKSGSPLVVDDLVINSAGGPNGRSLIAYNKDDGTEVWAAGNDQSSYASPTLATLGGVRQVISVNQDRVAAHRLSDGEELWATPWKGDSNSNATASQPVVLPGERVFLSKGYNIGSALLQIDATEDGKFSVEKLWAESRLMNSKLTNVVVQGDFIYGLSGGILECINWKTGTRQWKRGRYGHGQNILVGDVLLVTTENPGDVVLVAANPEKYEELARFSAIEGKTWNNPAITGPYLLVRNHREAACYKLPLRE